MTKKEVVMAMNDAVLVRINDWRCAQAYLIQKVLNDGKVLLRRANVSVDGQAIPTEETKNVAWSKLEKLQFDF
ncbi:hypothetical protein [Limosilactobacillus mucosae]|jgi:hypothetical protein|uniref:hypothetical protein n=1 Tax=Limosilactobacillus mucosae TaxID=97478 RepID=UPI003EB89CD7